MHFGEMSCGYVGFRGAGDETRTRDSLLGRQVLYQLSYPRNAQISLRRQTPDPQEKTDDHQFMIDVRRRTVAAVRVRD